MSESIKKTDKRPKKQDPVEQAQDVRDDLSDESKDLLASNTNEAIQFHHVEVKDHEREKVDDEIRESLKKLTP